MRTLVGAFNKEKALVGDYCETDGSFYSTNQDLLMILMIPAVV